MRDLVVYQSHSRVTQTWLANYDHASQAEKVKPRMNNIDCGWWAGRIVPRRVRRWRHTRVASCVGRERRIDALLEVGGQVVSRARGRARLAAGREGDRSRRRRRRCQAPPDSLHR